MTDMVCRQCGTVTDITPLTALWDGATQHRGDGADPHLGVVVAEADIVTPFDVAERIVQVGIGEGRPDSKMSAGMGWGTFTLKVQGD